MKMMKQLQKIILTIGLCLLAFQLLAQKQSLRISGVVKAAATEEPLVGAVITIEENQRHTLSDEQGAFYFEDLTAGKYRLKISYLGRQDQSQKVHLKSKNQHIVIEMIEDLAVLSTVVVEDNRASAYGIQRLRQVEASAIYASKKNELISVDQLTINKAANNSRQVYAKVSGLNIWESDGAGVQLGIGGRGLSPNRNSNFNTRQNGYDISADALGPCNTERSLEECSISF